MSRKIQLWHRPAPYKDTSKTLNGYLSMRYFNNIGAMWFVSDWLYLSVIIFNNRSSITCGSFVALEHV